MKLRINNKDFSHFNNFIIQLNLDSVASAFSFLARFDPENENHKILFLPLSFPKVEIFTDNGDLLLTGVIISHQFKSSGKPNLVKLSGYSSGGILEDCNIPFSSYPLESLERSLRDIATKLLNIFKLKLIIDSSAVSDSNLIYEKSVASPTESVKSYLSKLTSQRNVVMSHNEKGDIIFFKVKTDILPKISLDPSNTIKMNFNINGQKLHSEISVLRQPSQDNENLSPVDTVKNLLIKQFRPSVKVLTSGTDTDTSKAADNVRASEMSNISLSIELPKILDLSPGDLIDVQGDELYLFEKTKFIVQSVVLKETNKSLTMSLLALLPEAFNGKTPKNIFT